MWQAEHFAAPGRSIGVDSTSRCLHWLKPQERFASTRPPRAARSHHRWSWHDRLGWNAWWGPTQFRVTVAGVPAFLAVS